MILGWQHLSEEDKTDLLQGMFHGNRPPGPFHVEIHPSDRCNARCFFCSTHRHRKGQELDWQALARSLHEAQPRGLKSIRLTGGGEALIYSHISELLDLCCQLGVRLSDITTNGLNLQEKAEQILAPGLDTLAISLNEATPDAYARTMGVDKKHFPKVLAGIEAFNARRDNLPSEARPELRIQFFIWKNNYRQISRMYALARQMQADVALFMTMEEIEPGLRMNEHEIAESQNQIEGIMHESLRFPGMALSFLLPHEKGLTDFVHKTHQTTPFPLPREAQEAGQQTIDHRIRFCMMPWYNCTLSASGRVSPCCLFIHNDMAMGNINEKPLSEIWLDTPYQQMRHAFKKLLYLKDRFHYRRDRERYIEPICLSKTACPFSHLLCDPPFYLRVQAEVIRHLPFREKAHYHLSNLKSRLGL